jgi:hypothetical protein
MPVVPYSSVPHVNPTPLQVPRLSPAAPQEAFGGGIAAEKGTLGDLSGLTSGAQRIADESHRIALQAKQEADQVAFTHAYGALTNGVTDLLHGPNGVLDKKGSDSFTAPEDVQDQYAEMAKGIRDRLGNDTQREIFDKAVQNEWSRVNEQTQQHVAQQRQIYDAQGTDALIEAKGVEAVKGYQNPDVVDAAVEAQQAAVADHLRRNGAPEDLIANKKAEVASNTRFQVLQQMVDNHQDLAASAYLAKYHDEFVGRNLTQAEALVNRGSIEGEGIRYGDIITGMAPTPQGSPVQAATTEDAAMREAAKIQEPLVREKTEQRISLFFNRKAASTRQSEQDAFEKGYQILRAHDGDLSAVPLTVRTAMGAMHDENLTSEAHRIQTVKDPGDPEKFLSLLNQAYFNPDQFAQEDIPGADGLSTAQKTRLMGLQRTVGGRAVRQDEVTLQRDVTHAQADSRFYTRKAEAAGLAGDKEGQAANEALATRADLELIRANDALTEHRKLHHTPTTPLPTGIPSPSAPLTPPTVTPPASTGDIDLRTSTGSAAAVPMIKPTPQMLIDVARKGPRYAEYLRSMHIDAPLVIAPPKVP